MNAGDLRVAVERALGEADQVTPGSDRVLHQWWLPDFVQVAVTETLEADGALAHSCLVLHWTTAGGVMMLLSAMSDDSAGMETAIREVGASGLLPDNAQDWVLSLLSALRKAAQEVA